MNKEINVDRFWPVYIPDCRTYPEKTSTFKTPKPCPDIGKHEQLHADDTVHRATINLLNKYGILTEDNHGN